MKVLKKILRLLLCFLFVILCTMSDQSTYAYAEDSFAYSLTINLITYTGNYTGETSQGIPDGYGIFITDEDSPEQFTYEGEFSGGTFYGEGIVYYGDELTLESNFKNGNPRGKATIIYSDGSYRSVKFKSGILTGVSTLYSMDDEYIGYDFYYDGESIEQLKTISTEIDYNELYTNYQYYYGDVICVKCSVTEVYEMSTYCILKLVDMNDNIYWCQYSNVAFSTYNQAIMPQVEVDENITIYAFYRGLATFPANLEDECGGFLYPLLTPITADTEDNDIINRETTSFEYESVCRYPYDYYNLRKTLRGNVESIVYQSDNICYLKFISNAGDIYYIHVDMEELSYVPAPGDKIKVRYYYNGLYKALNAVTEYYDDIYPLLEAIKLDVLNNN